MRGACQPLSPGLSLVGKAISEPGLQTRNQVQRGEQGGRGERAGWADPRGPAAWPHRCDLEEAQPLKARALSKPQGAGRNRPPANARPDAPAECTPA